jgi:glycosyltransferase involved in cell wall biosynthesis
MMSLHNFAAGLTGLPAIIGPVGGAQEIPPSCRKYGDPIQEIPRKLSIRTTPYLPAWRRAVRSVERILCANEETAQYFLRQGIPEEHLSVRQPGYPGIAFAGRAGADIKADALPAVLDIFWGGRLVRCKGLEVLLDAVVKARNEGLECFLHVTGDGPDKKKIANIVRRLGIQDFVKFYGWLPKEQMRQLRSRCHLLAFTSLRETTGLALIEMLLSGQPSAVLNCGGPQSIIDGLSCFVIDPEQAVDQLVEAMRSVRGDFSAALKRAMQTEACAVSRFDWAVYLNDLMGWYSGIVSTSKANRYEA